MIGQSQIDPHNAGMANANPYGRGVSGILPAGLNVITSYAVNKIMLDAAVSGGTEDKHYDRRHQLGTPA